MPDSTNRPLKIFLCHATQDKSVVRELSQRLSDEGWIDPWLDEKKLLPGQDWSAKIEEAVETSDIVIICLSSNSVSKDGFVQKELRYAREVALEKAEETIFLIPLRLDDCKTPRGLRLYQWADYFGVRKDETYSRLLKSLQLRYEQILRIEEELARNEKERLEQEAAEKALQEKAEREAAEKAALERARRIEAEKAAWEKRRIEAAERAEREKLERAKQQKLKREVAEKAKKEKTEREAAEKAIFEKTKREATERAKSERAIRQAALINTLKVTYSKSTVSLKSAFLQAKPLFGVGVIIGLILILIWVSSWAVPQFFFPTLTAEASPTRNPIATITSFSPTVVFTRTPEPGITPTQLYPSTSTFIQSPTNSDGTPISAILTSTLPCYGLSFASDVTIPDNTRVVLGQRFTKTWKVKNTGSCAWSTGFQFRHVGGDSFGGNTFTLPSSVAPGTVIDISIDMVIPDKRGVLRSNWRMFTSNEMAFGDEMYVQVVVETTSKDGMVLNYVPAGDFIMGSSAKDVFPECQKFYADCQLFWFEDEEPRHTVYLDSFWIDQTEVTNAMYARCVGDGKCNMLSLVSSYTRDSYYGNPEFDNYPVIHVSWEDANDYCAWAGRRLPTEAEWEKAARGENGNIYPWGNQFDGELVNFCDKNCPFDWAYRSYDDGFNDTSPVGSYPNGASPYGALDMAGNVWEWVADWYGKTYYASSPISNPRGPSQGSVRVLRGGSWDGNASVVRVSDRDWHKPALTFYPAYGIRCAMNEVP